MTVTSPSVAHAGPLDHTASNTRAATLHHALTAAVVALVVLHAAVLAYHVAATVAFPYDLDYGEGYVLNDAVRLARGEFIYTDLQQFPMVRSPYPPLFPALWSLLVPLAGPVFWPGRLLAALALVGIAGLIAWNARRARAPWWLVVASAGIVISSSYVYGWAGYARVDTLALLLALGGLLVAQWSAGWRGIVLSALLCGLAILTKQTAAVAAVAVLLALLIRAPRRGIAFGLLLALPGLGVLVLLDNLTDGQFLRHVVFGNAQNPLSLPRAIAAIGQFLLIHLPLVGLALWWLARISPSSLSPAALSLPIARPVLDQTRRAEGGHHSAARYPSLAQPVLRAGRDSVRLSPVALYLPLSLLATVSAGNHGSSVNYFLDALVAVALALPFAAHALRQRALLVPALLVLQLLVVARWPNTFGLDPMPVAPHARTPTSQDYAVGAALDALVQSESGAVLADPAGFALRNGRPVYTQPFDLRAEAHHGRWDPAPLVQAFATGQFPLVIQAYNLLPFEVEPLLETHYVEEATLPSPNGLTYRTYRYNR